MRGGADDNPAKRRTNLCIVQLLHRHAIRRHQLPLIQQLYRDRLSSNPAEGPADGTSGAGVAVPSPPDSV